MKFVTLALAALALAVPATLLFTSANDGLMVDRTAKVSAHPAATAAHDGRAYAAR